MKTFLIEDNLPGQQPEAWMFIPDSALTNAGKPFFIPEFAPEIEARPVAFMKIGRLGKTVAPRFASRYFSEVAFGVWFSAPLLRRQLIDKGLPADRACSFDRSVIMSPFFPKDEFADVNEVALLKDGEPVSIVCKDFSDPAVGPKIEAVSAENTLKMGDLIIPYTGHPTYVAIGDTLLLTAGSRQILRIEIK